MFETKLLTGQANAKATRAINPVNANPQTKVPSPGLQQWLLTES